MRETTDFDAFAIARATLLIAERVAASDRRTLLDLRANLADARAKIGMDRPDFDWPAYARALDISEAAVRRATGI